jgi:hypothetical protein
VPSITHIFSITVVDVSWSHAMARQCGAMARKGDVINPASERLAQK